MIQAADFLVEIGTEELPPKALRSLMDAFGERLTRGIDEARLEHGTVEAFASPRRLAVLVRDLAERQHDRAVEHKGPPSKVAFDDAGEPTPAATAFARKCGVGVADLGRQTTDKGEWLVYESVEPGRPIDDLLPRIIERALGELPIPRRMRWGAGEAEFVRPVHWVVLLHGARTIDASIMGIAAGNTSRGHRFHAAGDVEIAAPDRYLETLETAGHVMASFEQRRKRVRELVESTAETAGGQVVDGESLYDEVAALVEWPVPVLGAFDDAFLSLPREAVVSTLTGHQRYFPLADADGALLPKFITVANLESREPDRVREGNERVVRPRLADAAFFWDNDRKLTLQDREERLQDVVYQQGLGSLRDKSRRVEAIARWLAEAIHHDAEAVARAARLAKCDLLTGMVGEFPELQGTMGGYYASSDGEDAAVASAISEQYLPRFAGDALPVSTDGQILAVADKMDTLAGVFALGKKPSGNRDPFGLRRAALGVVRLLIECELDVDLRGLIAAAVAAQPDGKADAESLAIELYAFITDRLRHYFLDRDAGLAVETFEAVMARQPSTLLDFERRLAAVQAFLHLEQAASLAAANKRIANILRKAGDAVAATTVDPKLLEDGAERGLYNALAGARDSVRPMLEVRSYAEVLNTLADLRDPVDHYFDDVMVMADDERVKNNRLALLGEIRALFLHVADISRLAVAQA